MTTTASTNAWSPIDEWRLPTGSFHGLFGNDRHDGAAPFLRELDRATGGRRVWTRDQWRTQVARVAVGLVGRGVLAGDTVAVLAGNSADALAVAFACWAHGWVYLPLNAHEDLQRHSFIVEHAGCRIIAHAPEALGRAVDLAALTGASAVALGDLASGSHTESLPTAPGWDAAALRIYTSGTTGVPKCVLLTGANLVTDADALSRVTGWDETTRALVVLPIHHVNGLIVSCLQAWYVGASVVLADRFRSETFWSDVAAESVTVASMVPTLLEFLLAGETEPGEHSLREVFTGAGPLMTETALGFERRFGTVVRHLYGLSETTAVATLMPVLSDPVRHDWYAGHGFPSIGPAVPHVEVGVQAFDGAGCAAGERGEIVIRGATVMREYAGRPEATAETLRDGWFHSGDEGFWLAHADGTPYFFVTGRIKELIIRGGVNISPFQVDEVLNAHPKVRFALSVPFDNRYYGEEIAAYVVPAEPVEAEEILAFCADRLDFAYRPKVVLFGDEVPFTATGKAKRLALKQRLAEQLAPYRDVQFRRSEDAVAAGSASAEED